MKDIKIWYLILSAFFYYTITLEGLELISYIIFYGVPAVYICLNLKYLGRLVNVCMKCPLKYYVFYTCILLFGAMVIPVLHKTFDFSYISGRFLALPKELIRVICLAIIFIRHISPEGDYKLFIRYYLLSCCCYVLFTAVIVAFPGIKMLLYEIVKDSEYSRQVALQPNYATRYGWSGFSGFGYTLRCTWGVCLTLYLILDDIKKRNTFLYGVLGVLLMGNMFYGRIGLFVSAALCMLFALFLLKKRPKIFVVITVVGVIGIIGIIVIVVVNEQARMWFNWAFSIFINFFRTGRLETASATMVFEDMIFFPGVKTLLIGDGRYTVGELYYMETDVGFMRPMLFGGILFTAIRYLSILCLLWAFVKHKSLFKKTSRWFLIPAGLIVLVAFEVKGEIVEASATILFGMVLLINYYYSLNRDKKGGSLSE